jgi:hypothetical protein
LMDHHTYRREAREGFSALTAGEHTRTRAAAAAPIRPAWRSGRRA